MLQPRPPAARGRAGGLDLDPVQQQVLDLRPDASVLVAGSAGSGKTTAALHRLRVLERLAQRRRRRFRAVVLVPTEGLQALARATLDRFGLGQVEVYPVEGWLAAQGRRVFPDVPFADGRDAGMAVIRLKRHPAVREVLPALARERGGGTRARHYDLFHLWGDTALLGRIVAAAGGALPASAIARVRDHACVQFTGIEEERDEEEAVLRDQYGVPLDEGTPMQDARSIDAEDFPVLFELDRARRGERPLADEGLRVYDHIVLDEAQEVAPMELATVGRALAPGGAITVVGDERQQLDPSAWFAGWSGLAGELGREVPALRLEGSHRCPPPVAAFANAVLAGGGAGLDAVARSRFDDEAALATALARELRGVARRDPDASVALLCRTPLAARRLFGRLRERVDARFGLGRSFAARAGTVVTHLDEIRGLEFDFVVLPDVVDASYPDTLASRRSLYLAATRARHQLWVLGVGASPAVLGA